jgi:hypothetical protein
MKSFIRARARPLLATAGAAVAVLAMTGAASAQSITFAGYTQGCFYQGSTSEGTCTLANSATLLGMGYVRNPSGFSNNVVAVANGSQVDGGYTAGTLGTLQHGTAAGLVGQSNQNYTNLTGSNTLWFRLALFFDSGTPSVNSAQFTFKIGGNADGSSGPTFQLQGIVSSGMSAGGFGPFVDGSWQQVLQTFTPFVTITNTQHYGTALNNGSMGKDGSVLMSGQVYARTFQESVPNENVVPEPFTIGLLATGLLGVGAARRRRRQATEA